MTVNLSALAGAGGQFLDANGNPLTGGKLYSYAAGTTTPQTTYTSVSGAVPHTNPIILDAAGRVPSGEIWLTAGLNYKFFLTSSTDVTIATWDNITGINGTGIATNASNVAFDPAGAGAVPTTVQAKLRELVSVTDFGADPTGVADSTAAFVAACATTGSILVPPGTYEVTGTIPVYGSLYGTRGSSIINMTLSETLDKGFDLQPSSSISGLTINRNAASPTYADGFFGNAITVGVNADASVLIDNVSIKDITIVGSGTQWNTMVVGGNVENFTIDSVDVSGIFLLSCLIHWRSKTVAGVITTYHPRLGKVKNYTAESANAALGEYGLPYISAGHDISMENIQCRNTSSGLVIASGTYGGQFAAPESAGRVLTNLLYNNVSVYNVVSTGLQISGRTDPIPAINNRWFMTDSLTSVLVNNYYFEAGNETNNSTEPLRFDFANNVVINNANIQVLEGYESALNNAWAGEFYSSTNLSISGAINYGRGARFFSGKNIRLNGIALSKNEDVSQAGSSDYGVAVYGDISTAVTAAAVSLNGTNITLSLVTCNIYPGMKFTQGGNTFYFAGSAQVNDVNTIIAIEPAVANIASGATITIQEGIDGFDLVDCEIQRFNKGFAAQGVSGSECPRNLVIKNNKFYSAGTDHVYLLHSTNVSVVDNAFERGNYDISADGADVNLRDGCKTVQVTGNEFNQLLDTNSIYNVYVTDESVGTIISDNQFMKHNTDTTTFSTASSIYLDGSGATGEADNLISTNFYGSAVINKVLPSTSRCSTTIGSNRIGYASAVPTAGVWRQGDVIWNTGATSAGFAGWICTVAGTPGTWRTFGVIS